jgi:hypothetical protein
MNLPIRHFSRDEALERWSLDAQEIIVCFSGSKGFHVTIRTAGIDPAHNNHHVARRLATEVASAVGIKIDESVYLPSQIWRAFNSRHHKTGLFKLRIDADDLLQITPEAVLRLATVPISFDLPQPVRNPAILAEWAKAAKSVRDDADSQQKERKTVASSHGGKINALTWAFLYEGAGEGERHRLLFSAAANLAEFATIDELIAAILSRPGIDSGLTPLDVARQIECGIKHARKNRDSN